MSCDGGDDINKFGNHFEDAGMKWTKELCMKDSDGDGQSNGLELGGERARLRALSTRSPCSLSCDALLRSALLLSSSPLRPLIPGQTRVANGRKRDHRRLSQATSATQARRAAPRNVPCLTAAAKHHREER